MGISASTKCTLSMIKLSSGVSPRICAFRYFRISSTPMGCPSSSTTGRRECALSRMTERISACGAFTGRKTTFSHGVSTSRTNVSENCSALCTSSVVSSSSAPSAATVSMMSYNSSSVTVGSSFAFLKGLLTHALSLENMNETGVKNFISRISEPDTMSAKRSLQAFANRLGIISDTKNTTTVITTVVASTAPSPHSFVAISVAMLAQPICIMLLPIRSVVSALSK